MGSPETRASKRSRAEMQSKESQVESMDDTLRLRVSSILVNADQEREIRWGRAEDIRSKARHAKLSAKRKERSTSEDGSESASSQAIDNDIETDEASNDFDPGLATPRMSPMANASSRGVADQAQACCHERSFDPNVSAEQLRCDGFTIVPIQWMKAARLEKMQQELLHDLRRMPEYKHPITHDFVVGGFSALGNPSSFHNSTVRKLRQYAQCELLPIFIQLVQTLPGDQRAWRLEQLIDRVLFRKKSVATQSAKLGRYETPLSSQEDQVYEGWWNLTPDNKDEFICVPGSHLRRNEGPLFADTKKVVHVPSGSILVFHHSLMHEFARKKSKVDTLRLYLGWRFTQQSSPMVNNIEQLLFDQAVIPLKSKQVPPMYGKLHWANWKPRIEEFSKKMDDRCVETKPVKGGSSTVRVVHRQMRSLAEYGFEKYLAYSMDEISMHKPSQDWHIMCGCDQQQHNLALHI